MLPSVFYTHILEGIFGEWTEFLAGHATAPVESDPSPRPRQAEKDFPHAAAPEVAEIAA